MSRGASGSIFFTIIYLFVLLIVFRASSESISEKLEGSTPLPFTMPQRPDFHSNKPGLIFSLTATSAQSNKSRAAVDYTPIGVEPHGPTRGVQPIAVVTNDSQSYLVASSI